MPKLHVQNFLPSKHHSRETPQQRDTELPSILRPHDVPEVNHLRYLPTPPETAKTAGAVLVYGREGRRMKEKIEIGH